MLGHFLHRPFIATHWGNACHLQPSDHSKESCCTCCYRPDARNSASNCCELTGIIDDGLSSCEHVRRILKEGSMLLGRTQVFYCSEQFFYLPTADGGEIQIYLRRRIRKVSTLTVRAALSVNVYVTK